MSVIVDSYAAETWHYLAAADPTRLVRKVDLCTALATGRDAWDDPVDQDHLHTFLMVTLVSTPGLSDDVYLVERVLSTGGAYHSVTPIEEGLSKGGSLFHPDVHDRICVVPEDQSTAARASPRGRADARHQ
ncbi:hypothetical protein JVU11DRAFT_2521 [Chiua virens]|nr:hypothetical protein JVU11DRAFT_2521 [Chiua virens]